MTTDLLGRRSALAALGIAGLSAADLIALEEAPKPKNNLNQSICRWCSSSIPTMRSPTA